MNTVPIAAVSSVLSRSAFFSGLSPESRLRAAAACRRIALRKKEVLFWEQTEGDAMYLLEQGAVQLGKTAEDGTQVIILTLKPGETFGEVVLFEEHRYPVTATAVTDSVVLVFARRAIRRLLEERAFRDEFITMLMRKQRYLADRLRDRVACDVESRLLVFLRDRYGAHPTLRIDLSKKDIAAAIGVTPETLSRLLAQRRQDGQLTWQGDCVTVSDALWQSMC
jgi:CRP-like cAMP-binding protein